MKEYTTKPFECFDKDWALVTAGNMEDYNTMTISWGSMGTLWSKPIVTIYVKPIRYTYQFLEENDYFTISFFPDDYKKDLGILGSQSGRDGDKVSLTQLTLKQLKEGVTFKEATRTIVCKKIYYQDLDIQNIPDKAIEKYYEKEEPHRMYIGEVIDIIEKEFI